MSQILDFSSTLPSGVGLSFVWLEGVIVERGEAVPRVRINCQLFFVRLKGVEPLTLSFVG